MVCFFSNHRGHRGTQSLLTEDIVEFPVLVVLHVSFATSIKISNLQNLFLRVSAGSAGDKQSPQIFQPVVKPQKSTYYLSSNII